MVHGDLDNLLAAAMLDANALNQLIEATRDDLMPFSETRKNLILAAIHNLHSRHMPVDIIALTAELGNGTRGIELSDLNTIVRDPLLNPLRSQSSPSLSMRLFCSADVRRFVEAVRECHSPSGVWPAWYRADFSVLDAVAYFSDCKVGRNSGTDYAWGILSSDAQELFGGVSITQINLKQKTGVLEAWVRPSRQRQGIAREALKVISQFGFREIGLNRLEFAFPKENLGVSRIAESVGARYEGIARNRLILHGLPTDALVYSLIPVNAWDEA